MTDGPGLGTPLALLLLPLAALPWLAARRPRRRGVPLPTLGWLPAGRSGRAAHAGPLLRAIALALLVIALARPRLPGGWEVDHRLGIDIMVALDISGSMRAEDFQPDNRITAAKKVIGDFVAHERANRLGLVAFAGRPATICPLTEDTDALLDALKRIDFDSVDQDGTAIGDAIGTCLYRLEDRTAKSRVIVLLTDGENNAGMIDPLAAARMAAAKGVKVDTIAVGRPGGAPIPIYDAFGHKDVLRTADGRPFLPQIAEGPLQQIAATTGGVYFRATDTAALEASYRQIASLERTEIASTRHLRLIEAYGWPLGAALLLLLAEFLWVHRRAPLLSARWWRKAGGVVA